MKDTNKKVFKINKLNKYKIDEIIAYLIIFSVFMGSNFIKLNFGGVKINIARILMILPIFVILIDIIKNKKIEIKFKNKSIKYCMLFFIIWSIYSIINIFNTKDLYSYIIINFYICIGTVNILFFLKHIDIEEKKEKIFNIINICAIINCLYYIFLYFVQKQNIGGFYFNPNDLATMLNLAIPISINLIFNSKNKTHKVYSSLSLIILIFCFVNIMSRACILGMCFAISAFVFLESIKYRKKILNNKKLKILIAIIIIIMCFIFIMYVCQKYVGTINFLPVEDAQTSNNVRTNLIYNGLHFLTMKNNLFTGIGTGNIEFYLRNYSIYSINDIYNFHNFWLDLIVEYGMLIFSGFIAVYVIICKELYKKNNTVKNIFKDSNSVFILFFISFIIASISSSTIITREWIWITIAFVISYINRFEMRKK